MEEDRAVEDALTSIWEAPGAPTSERENVTQFLDSLYTDQEGHTRYHETRQRMGTPRREYTGPANFLYLLHTSS